MYSIRSEKRLEDSLIIVECDGESIGAFLVSGDKEEIWMECMKQSIEKINESINKGTDIRTA